MQVGTASPWRRSTLRVGLSIVGPEPFVRLEDV